MSCAVKLFCLCYTDSNIILCLALGLLFKFKSKKKVHFVHIASKPLLLDCPKSGCREDELSELCSTSFSMNGYLDGRHIF